MTTRQQFLILIITLILQSTYGQEANKNIDSLIQTWDYKIYTDTQKVKIIEYLPAISRCGRGLNYSMAICFISTGQTIRIIEQCPKSKTFKQGDIITFVPSNQIPLDKNPYLPFIDGQINPFILKYSFVKLTTYGHLFK